MMNVEAKRASRPAAETDDLHVENAARTVAWFGRMHARFNSQLQHVHTEHWEQLRSAMALRDHIGAEELQLLLQSGSSIAEALSDVLYLSIFPNLKSLSVVVIRADVPIPSDMSIVCANLDRTAIERFAIRTDQEIVTVVHPTNLRTLKTLSLECPVQLVNNNAPIELPVLEHLIVGEMRTGSMEAVKSRFAGAFAPMPTLKTLRIVNCRNVRVLEIARVAPALQELEVSYSDLADIPLIPTLRRIALYDTALPGLDSNDFEVNFHQLETLIVRNQHVQPGETPPLFINRLGDVRLADMPALQSLTLDVPSQLTSLTFEGGGTAAPFRALKKFELIVDQDDAGRWQPLSVDTEFDDITGLLPALETVSIAYGGPDVAHGNDLLQANMPFPEWLIMRYPQLASYTGPLHVADGGSTLNLNEYMELGTPISEGYRAMLRSLVQHNQGLFIFNGADDITNVLLRRPPLTNEEWTAWLGRREARLTEAEEARVRAEMMFAAGGANLLERRRPVLARADHGVPRAEPYMARWRSTLACEGQLPHRLFGVLDEDGVARAPQECPICGNAFDAAAHVADAAEIETNDFVRDIDALRADMEAGRFGCVVVCNVLPRDFDANHLRVPASSTREEAVHALQCEHYLHFFHRVCYAVALYDGAQATDVYGRRVGFSCPLTRFFFDGPLPAPLP